MRYWLIIYSTNTGFVYGFVCKAHRISDAESEFWRAMETATGKTIKSISELPSEIVDIQFSLYEERQGA